MPLRKFFLIACLPCNRLGGPLVIPFAEDDQRAKWAKDHHDGTGHNEFAFTTDEIDIPEVEDAPPQ